MNTVTSKIACKLCRYNFLNIASLIGWKTSDELFNSDGSLISEEEASQLLLDWYRDVKYECDNCDNVGNFHVWDIKVDSKILQPKTITELEKERMKQLKYTNESRSLAVGAIYQYNCEVCMSSDRLSYDYEFKETYPFDKEKDIDTFDENNKATTLYKMVVNEIILHLRANNKTCKTCGSIGHWDIFELAFKVWSY